MGSTDIPQLEDLLGKVYHSILSGEAPMACAVHRVPGDPRTPRTPRSPGNPGDPHTPRSPGKPRDPRTPPRSPPGEPGGVKTSVVGDTLTVGVEMPGVPRAAVGVQVRVDDRAVHVTGFRGGLFERDFSCVVPVDEAFDVERARASFEDGFLTVACPRVIRRVVELELD